MPCAMMDLSGMRAAIGVIRQQTSKPFNINFFVHEPPALDQDREAAWRRRLAPYYQEFRIDQTTVPPTTSRSSFDESMCKVVEEAKPAVVSFHFGLPRKDLVARVKQAGCLVISTATTVAEAIWLEEHGCDAIIAQGYEAGGHRGMFLSSDLAGQIGTMALVPQVVDAVKVPVIAAGGIGDGRGVAAALALGASAAQIGTAYLFTPEALITDLHRAALEGTRDRPTALTNVFTGRPARGLVNRVVREVGPMSDLAPSFPTAGTALTRIRSHAERELSSDFSPLWAGQAFGLGGRQGSGALTRQVAEAAQRALERLSAT